MAVHETFTDNPGLAFLLGPARPDFGLGNTWFGSVSIWGGAILNPGSNTNPVVEVAVTGIPGVTHVQAEVFGVRSYDGTGLFSVNVTHIEWSLPGSATVLARYTFANPVVFPLSVGRFGGDWRFVDILNEVQIAGGTAQMLFDDYFQNADSLIGGNANDIMYGGGGNDTIDGGGGADTLRGDAGADTFNFRSGDAVSGESVTGGSDTDRIVAIGALVNGDIFQAGGVNLSAISINGVEELHLNGTEAVISVNTVGTGLATFVGRTGFGDQLTLTDVANGNIGVLSLTNWDLVQDTVAIVGTANSDNVVGSFGRDVFLGLGGTDFFDGAGGDDRFLILENDFNPLDQFVGGIGNDVLQVDSTAIGTVQMTPLSDLRGLRLDGIEVLDVNKGSFSLDAADFVGAVSGTIAAPVLGTVGLNRIVGNGTDAAFNIVLLEIHLGGLLGIDLRTTVFENWNDGFFVDKTIRIVAGAQTQLIYCPNEETWVNGSASTVGVFVTGGTQQDQVFGSSFNDFIQAGDGADYIVTLNGNDFVDTGEGNDSVWGGIGNDVMGGLGGNDSLSGEAGNDSLTGAAGNDSLYGGADVDLLSGGIGSDYIDGGGSSSDLVSYQLAAASVRVDLVAQATNTGEAAGDTLVGIEGVIGSAHDDTLRGDGLANGLYGQNGNDRLEGFGEADILLGGGGNDAVYGGSGNDTLGGEAGGDRLWGGTGADQHIGGSDGGIDYARYDEANHGNLTIRLDNASLNTGAAAVGDTYSGIEGVVSGAGNDAIYGDGLRNYLFGMVGADRLYGGGGNDYLSGGTEGDQLWGGAGSDQHIGGDGAGVDYARYDDANHGNLTIRLDNAALNTGAAAVGDTYSGIEGLVGGVGNDLVIGNALANRLLGQGGADVIDGLGGNDYLNGGTGADRFRMSTALGTGNIDTIADFAHGVDDIVLLRSVFASIGASLTSSEFRIGAAVDANDYILYNSANGAVTYDSNGNGAGGMLQFAKVTPGTVLTFDDFIMV